MFQTDRLSCGQRTKFPLRVSIEDINKGMTRVRRRLIEDFLLPALNDRRYGDRLKWEDKEKNCFSIRWSHKNAAKWSYEDTVVFQDWDRMKGHYQPNSKGYYMQAKQRFRAALYKLATVKVLKSDDKHVKKYQLVLDNEKRKLPDSNLSKVRYRKLCPNVEISQKSIRTSVICRNDSYYERQLQFNYDQVPQSPTVSANDYSDNSDGDSSDLPDRCSRVKHVPNESECTESTNSSNCIVPNNNNYFTKYVNNDFGMVSIKCEPPDGDIGMMEMDCEPAGENYKIVPVICELTFSEASPLQIKEEPNLEEQQCRTMSPTLEKININEIKVATKRSPEEQKAFIPKLRAKYLMEGSENLPGEKTQHVVHDLSKPSMPKIESSGNFCSSVFKTDCHVQNEKYPFLSKDRSTAQPSDKTSVPVNRRSNPHVPIPPLPGYSKDDIAVRPLDTYLRLRNKCTVNKSTLDNESKWAVVEHAISADGPLNLCTKPSNPSNERYSCADR